MPLINRFADPVVEAAYVAQARAAQSGAVRWLSVIAIVGIGSFALLHPLFLANDAAMRFDVVAGLQLAAQAAYWWATRTRAYARSPWLDAVFFLVFSGLGLAASLLQLGVVRPGGWPFTAVFALNTYVLLAFAFLCFVASFRWFLAWMALQVVQYMTVIAVVGTATLTQSYTGAGIVVVAMLMLYANWAADARGRALFDAGRRLAADAREIETLLHNVLPPRIAERLRRGETVADAYPDVTLIYIDIVDFSGLTRRTEPAALIALLDRLFATIDAAAARAGVEKIKTLGDAYLAIAGAGTGVDGPAATAAAVSFAQAVQAAVADLELEVRIAVHSGPIVGGVIGRTRMSHDYWGEAMNLVSRLQEVAPPGGICLSDASRWRAPAGLAFDAPRRVAFKGFGDVTVHDLGTPAASARRGSG